MSEIVFSSLKSFDGAVSERDFNALVDAVQSIALLKGVGYAIARNATGTVLRVKAGQGGGSGNICPFDISVKAGTGAHDKIANVRAGSVNSLLPDNNFSDFHFNPSSVILAKLRCSSDGAKITGVTLIIDSSAIVPQTPTPFALPSSVDILIAVIVGGSPYRVIPCGSITLAGQEQFRTDKSPPADPGELQYIPYYSWVILGG